MKRTLIITTALATALFTTSAYGQDASVEDKYKVVEKRYPHTEHVCTTVDVPIYGNVGGGASGADVLGGMILGGILGKGISVDDKGAAAGAVLGGVFSADKKKKGNQQIVGYKQEQRCQQHTTYTTERKEVYSHSVVTFWHEGNESRVKFNRY